jgi:dTMP kinase
MIIAIEGLDSSGKTTQTELLKQYLNNQGYEVETFHFPNKNAMFGSKIYGYLQGNVDYTPEVIELLHTADKMNMQEYLNEFKNNKQKYLILDRYALSQYAYALANGFDEDWTLNLMKLYIQPDIKIYLNITPKESMQRKKELDKYESDIKFLTNVGIYYLSGCEQFNYYIIDGDDDKFRIHDVIKDLIYAV